MRRRACNNPRNYALKSLSAELLQRNTFRAAECALAWRMLKFWQSVRLSNFPQS